VVGVGQVTQKTDDFEGARRAHDLMIEATRVAAADSGTPALAARADMVGVVGGLWGYPDPGRLIAEAVGATEARTALTAYSGSMAQHLLTDYAARIQRGEIDVAIVAGGEAHYSASKRGENPIDLARVKLDDVEADEFVGGETPLFSKHEYRMGFSLPLVVYPLFGSAVRANLGQTQDEHRQEISSMWSDFSRVAATNPYAWDQEVHSATEISEPTDSNRMVSWPYTKLMNANMFVDQAAAIIICSSAVADELGVALDRRVFPLAAADVSDTPSFTERLDMHASPAIRVGGAAALQLARLGIDDIAHYDLYSCFPSIVQISTAALGIPAGTQLTQTGGLSLFGGPLNSYTLHGIASMTDTLRKNPGDIGLVHGNGGHMAKQSICLYSTDPRSEFHRANPQAEVDALPHRALDAEFEGPVTVESCTVTFGREGPTRGFATALTDRGNRVLGITEDETAMKAIMTEELVGQPATLAGEGQLQL